MSEFDEFWLLYPRKVAKGHARRAHSSALKKAPHATIQAGLTRFLGDLAARGTSMQYVPYPATWINGERWADELVSDGQAAGFNGHAAEDREMHVQARVIRSGYYLTNVSDSRAKEMVRRGWLDAETATRVGYLV